MKFLKDRLSRYNFTPEQMGVVRGIFAGKTNKEISYELCLSVGGVKYHVINIYKKMGLESREACIVTLWKIMTGLSYE